jgi:four helix bundle protein
MEGYILEKDMRLAICDMRQCQSTVAHQKSKISIVLSQITNHKSQIANFIISNQNNMHNFKELIVWKKAREMVKAIYVLSQKFPAEEKFGLTPQIRRAAVSIPSNIAEGCGRGSTPDCSHFLDVANGSAFEVETQLYIALDLQFIEQEEFNELNNKLQDVQKLIFGFKQSLKG